MRSTDHDGVVTLVRNRPSLVAELVRAVWRGPLPGFDSALLASEDLTQARAAEAHADAVVLLREGEVAQLAVVVEVQLRWDARKTYSWPLYQAAARQRHQCPAWVLVIAPNRAVARRAARPVALGAGSSFRAAVLGPDEVPVVSDPSAAREAPELAVLSAMMHGHDALAIAVPVALAAEGAVRSLPDATARLYLDLIESSLSAAAKRALEELMALPGYQWRSDFALKHRGEGREEGLEEGREEGLREALTVLLFDRFGALPTEVTERLDAASRETLLAWLGRSASAVSLEAVFQPG